MFVNALKSMGSRQNIGTVDKPTHNWAGFKRASEGAYEFLVFPNVFREEICAGLDYRFVEQLLVKEKLILPSKTSDRITTTHRVRGSEPIRLYHISSTIFSNPDKSELNGLRIWIELADLVKNRGYTGYSGYKSLEPA